MLLGDLMRRLEDETVAAATLAAIGDLKLTTDVVAAATQAGLSPGAFMVECVASFADRASDADWTTVISRMARAADPGEVLLRSAIRAAVPATAGQGCG